MEEMRLPGRRQIIALLNIAIFPDSLVMASLVSSAGGWRGDKAGLPAGWRETGPPLLPLTGKPQRIQYKIILPHSLVQTDSCLLIVYGLPFGVNVKTWVTFLFLCSRMSPGGVVAIKIEGKTSPAHFFHLFVLSTWNWNERHLSDGNKDQGVWHKIGTIGISAPLSKT